MKRRRPLEHIGDTQRDPQVRDELQRNLLGQANHSLVQWLGKNRMLAEQARILGQAILADDTADMPVRPSALPGDPKRLRGIPAIGGRGSVGGAIAGSRPGDSLAGKRGEDVLRGIRQRARDRDGVGDQPPDESELEDSDAGVSG